MIDRAYLIFSRRDLLLVGAALQRRSLPGGPEGGPAEATKSRGEGAHVGFLDLTAQKQTTRALRGL